MLLQNVHTFPITLSYLSIATSANHCSYVMCHLKGFSCQSVTNDPCTRCPMSHRDPLTETHSQIPTHRDPLTETHSLRPTHRDPLTETHSLRPIHRDPLTEQPSTFSRRNARLFSISSSTTSSSASSASSTATHHHMT